VCRVFRRDKGAAPRVGGKPSPLGPEGVTYCSKAGALDFQSFHRVVRQCLHLLSRGGDLSGEPPEMGAQLKLIQSGSHGPDETIWIGKVKHQSRARGDPHGDDLRRPTPPDTGRFGLLGR
jgi:hypothetical protein